MNFVWASVPLFFAFSYAGYFTLIRFNFYANISQELALHGLEMIETLQSFPKDKKTKFWDSIQSQSHRQEALLLPKKILKYPKRVKPILGFIYWIAVVYLGAIVYSDSWNSVEEWSLWFLILTMFVILFVFVPALSAQRVKNEGIIREKKVSSM